MVQPELHPPDEGREVDGDTGQPYADAAAPGIPEALTDLSAKAGGERRSEGGSAEGEVDLAVPLPAPIPVAQGDVDLRLTSPGIRLAQVKEELVAWVKTLGSKRACSSSSVR